MQKNIIEIPFQNSNGNRKNIIKIGTLLLRHYWINYKIMNKIEEWYVWKI